jgi:endonuclease/exonuclease/phosphatase family metal-dependent hydrolase
MNVSKNPKKVQKSKIKQIPFLLLLLLLLLLVLPIYNLAQNGNCANPLIEKHDRIMFYNVENLFDTQNDPLKRDEEYLPFRGKFWNQRRLNAKINRISQVIIAVGGWGPPVLGGLCEIENHLVLNELLTRTPLEKFGYRFIHQESPDPRGIDVALLYRSPQFVPLKYEAISIVDPAEKKFRTRDILYVKGVLQGDTLHLYVNHWPSKFGGVADSEPNRLRAASVLKQHIDGLMEDDPGAKIILMGDFNDTPSDPSLFDGLGAKPCDGGAFAEQNLYNLSYNHAQSGKGSHKFQAHWSLIDNIIVNGVLLKACQKGLYTHCDSFQIFDASFLLEPDNTHLGNKPFRTYAGFRYNNGFSDHLPVYFDLKRNQEEN